MPWQNQGGGGGPWGGGSGGGSGGGGGPWGRGGGGGGMGGQRPPDFDDMIRKSQERFQRFMPGGVGGGRGILLVLAVILVVWLLSGFYRVQPDEQGVVLRFGEWINTTQPGLNWHLPYPIESVETPSVEKIEQIEIGYRTLGGSSQRDVQQESLMLTGDQNIIDIDFTVQWKIADAGAYLFNVRAPEDTVKIAAESAMREIIGRTDIQPALTDARAEIESKTRSLLQEILNGYGTGVEITEVKLQNSQPPQPVIDAFNDVQRSLQDRDRLRNEAEAYRNDIIPRARGESQRILQDAQAYRERLINEAQGEAQRFEEVLSAYKQNPDVTRKRMYLETMQKIMGETDLVIMDGQIGGAGGTGAVPYLPLNELRKRSGGQDAN
jgi:membrane protease subunit HflK